MKYQLFEKDTKFPLWDEGKKEDLQKLVDEYAERGKELVIRKKPPKNVTM